MRDRPSQTRGDQVRASYDGSTLRLPKFLESAVEALHPWIYRDHVPQDLQLPTGSWVKIQAGRAIGWALWDATSPIALRVFSLQQVPDAAWVRQRVVDALSLRRACIGADTNAYRALYGEGDGLPGITVDVYAGYAVIVTYADCLDAMVPWVQAALLEQLELCGILWRRSSRQAGTSLDVIAGDRPPADLIISECGLRYYADLETGQKTGLFLDQRDNRQTLARYVKTGTLLNLFSYTGGFSVVAASQGARRVTSVDIAAPAMERAKENFALNGLLPAQHGFVAQDCYEFLAQAIESKQTFDVVVCDPPSLARHRGQLDAALKAYSLLNARGIRCTKVGGYYAAASCTSQVSPEAFRNMLGEAARHAERRFQILHEVGHAIDHPHFAVHPEGRYLKFVLGRVLERC